MAYSKVRKYPSVVLLKKNSCPFLKREVLYRRFYQREKVRERKSLEIRFYRKAKVWIKCLIKGRRLDEKIFSSGENLEGIFCKKGRLAEKFLSK